MLNYAIPYKAIKHFRKGCFVVTEKKSNKQTDAQTIRNVTQILQDKKLSPGRY